jgi:catechol 2,3-dioxygenase
MSHRLQPVESSPQPIDPRVGIGHVHLKSANLDRIHSFYVGVLGFNVVARMPNALFLAAGNYHHHLGFNTWESKDGPAPSAHMTGLYHVAILYPDRPALGDALKRLVAAAWPLDGFNDHGTHEALYLQDPDGNGLELYWDRPESEWPVDKNGHLELAGRQLDFSGLLAAAEQHHSPPG